MVHSATNLNQVSPKGIWFSRPLGKKKKNSLFLKKKKKKKKTDALQEGEVEGLCPGRARNQVSVGDELIGVILE